MGRAFEIETKQGGGRRWPLVGLLVMLALLGHDLSMTDWGGTAAATVDSLDERPLVVGAPGYVIVDYLRLDALPDRGRFGCASISSASTPGRACADYDGAVTVLPTASGGGTGPLPIIRQTPPTSPPDTRRALLQVFLI